MEKNVEGKKLERFYVDTTVLRLGKWLRLLGIDAPQLPRKMTFPTNGVLLTKKRLPANAPKHVFFVPFDNIEKQLVWFARTFPGAIEKKGFGTRCSLCNQPLTAIPRESVKNLVPDYVAQTAERFMKCPRCGKIYWNGTHPERMRAFLKRIFPSGGNIDPNHRG